MKNFRPSVSELLTLPINALVVDLNEYECTSSDVIVIADWLSYLPITNALASTPISPVSINTPSRRLRPILQSRSSEKKFIERTLSLRHLDFDQEEFNQMLDILRMVSILLSFLKNLY